MILDVADKKCNYLECRPKRRDFLPNSHLPSQNFMGCMKNYLLTVLENCSEEKFGQEAIEWAIVTGRITLTYNLTTDVKAIMGDCVTATTADGPSGQTGYDRIIEAYRRECQEHGDALVQLYHTSGLLEEILRPVSLAQRLPESVGT